MPHEARGGNAGLGAAAGEEPGVVHAGRMFRSRLRSLVKVPRGRLWSGAVGKAPQPPWSRGAKRRG